jgi:Tol biopolymer transport system component
VLTASAYKETPSLWIVNTDGTGFRQLLLDADQSLWSPDGSLLAVSTISKAGSSNGTALEVLDPTKTTRRSLINFEAELPWEIVSWSPDSQDIYYTRAVSPDRSHNLELWAVNQVSGSSRRIATVGAGSTNVTFSPDRTSFYFSVNQETGWQLKDSTSQRDIAVVPARRWCGFAWSPRTNEAIVCELDEKGSTESLKAVNVQSAAAKILGSITVPSKGAPYALLEVAPDLSWFAASIYQDGYYWINLSTGAVVPVPLPSSKNGFLRFIGWIQS